MGESSDEQSDLLQKTDDTWTRKDGTRKDWTRKDWILLFLGLLINVGDGIEIYLPGVLTQYVACEIGVNDWQEGILGCILYLTMGITTFAAAPLSTRFGRRETILLSLYGSIVSTIVCSVAGNYLTLLLSRALIGFTVGLNISVTYVFQAEKASSKKIVNTLILVSSLGYSVGSIWIPVIAYFSLDLLGWRTFLLIASLPIFIPPILILHIFLKDSSNLETITQAEPTESGEVEAEPTEDGEVEAVEVPNFKMRLFKLCFFAIINSYQGWGTILLLPSLIRLFNVKEVGGEGTNCETVTQGNQFFLLAFVAGAAGLGRIASPIIRKKIRFRILYTSLAVLILASYTMLLLIEENLIVIVVTTFLGKLVYGMISMEKNYISYDVRYFGKNGMAIGSGLMQGAGSMAAVAGTALVSFASPQIAIIAGLVLSVVQILVVNSMEEQDQW
ncbi:putative transporter svop-1 [Bolinopsis microptera]|uniref:putative transporter svop-1 n=1 Tax=Bolinopsis microptera TaxID=2820187 RepID=UPI003078E2B3